MASILPRGKKSIIQVGLIIIQYGSYLTTWLKSIIQDGGYPFHVGVQAYLIEKPSLELCRHLVMLRDYNISGRINLMEIPVLLHMLHFWKVSNICQTVCVDLLYGRPGFESRPGTPKKISLLSVSMVKNPEWASSIETYVEPVLNVGCLN